MHRNRLIGRAWPMAARGLGLVVLAGLGMIGFARLGIASGGAVLLVAGVIVGGWFDLPLPRRKGRTRLGLNVGGGLIPLLLAGYVGVGLGSAVGGRAAGSIAAVAAACFASARSVPDRGVFVPWPMIGMISAALGLSLAPHCAAGLAYVAAVVGSFLGADLLMLTSLEKVGATRAGLGGAGPFDGLVWTGLLAAYLAG